MKTHEVYVLDPVAFDDCQYQQAEGRFKSWKHFAAKLLGGAASRCAGRPEVQLKEAPASACLGSGCADRLTTRLAMTAIIVKITIMAVRIVLLRQAIIVESDTA